jgi:hypothetical protein
MSQRLPFYPAYWLATRPFGRVFIEEARALAQAGKGSFRTYENMAFRRLLDALPKMNTSEDVTLISREVQLALASAEYGLQQRPTYELAPCLVEELLHTDAGDLLLKDIDLPPGCSYLHLGTEHGLLLPDSQVPIEGAFLVNSSSNGFRVMVLGRQPAARALKDRLTESYALRFTPQCLELGVDAAVEEAIRVDQEDLAAAAVYLNQESFEGSSDAVASLQALNRQAAPAMHACLQLIVNAAAYLSAYPSDKVLGWPIEAPSSLSIKAATGTPKEQLRAKSKLQNLGFWPRWFVGQEFQAHAEVSVRSAHWRRGHWRNQAHGPQFSLRKLIWIRPVRVLGSQRADDTGAKP